MIPTYPAPDAIGFAAVSVASRTAVELAELAHVPGEPAVELGGPLAACVIHEEVLDHEVVDRMAALHRGELLELHDIDAVDVATPHGITSDRDADVFVSIRRASVLEMAGDLRVRGE